LSGFTGFLTFCRRPRTPSRPRGGTCCVFWRVRPEIGTRSALTGFLTDVDNPPERLTGLLTFSHRIAHFSGQRLTDFLTFGANLNCTSKSYNSQKRRSLEEKEEALRVVHNGDKTLSSHFHTRRHCILIEPGVTGEVRFVNKLFDLAA
jgi:hypothetical protein